MTKHIMITGGLGFIGHNLANYYLKEGYYVTVVDNLRSHYDHARLTKYRFEHIDNRRTNFIQLSCNQTYGICESLKSFYASPTAIIHLAESIKDMDGFNLANSINGNAVSMATLANDLGAKLIYVSSGAVYSDCPSPYKESYDIKPRTLLGILKRGAEDIVKNIHPNTVVIRTDVVYGPGDTGNNFISDCIKEMLSDKTFDFHVRDYSEIDAIYIDDFVKAVIRVEEYGKAGLTYNIGSGECRTENEIALTIKQLIGSKTMIKYEFGFDANKSNRGVLDCSLASEALGFKIYWPLVSGLTDYIRWMTRYDHL